MSRFTGQFPSGRRWVSPSVRPEPEWDNPRRAGRIFAGATGPESALTIRSDIERDTVSRVVWSLFRGMTKLIPGPSDHPFSGKGGPVPVPERQDGPLPLEGVTPVGQGSVPPEETASAGEQGSPRPHHRRARRRRAKEPGAQKKRLQRREAWQRKAPAPKNRRS